MNKQYVNGIQKRKKAYLMMRDSKRVLAMLALLVNDWEEHNVSTDHILLYEQAVYERGTKKGKRLT